MKFQVNSKDMLAAVTSASDPIRRAMIPLMECVLIDAGERLMITGTSLDEMVTAECVASVTDRGGCAVNADDVKRFLSSVGNVTVDVTGSPGKLCLSSGRAKADLFAFHAAEFPAAMDAAAPHEVHGAASAVPLLVPFASTDPSREFINGIRIAKDGAVATDGKRLARHPATCDAEATIHNSALRIIGNVLKANGRLFIGDTIWRAEAERVTARGKLLDLAFPDWRRLVDTDAVPLFSVDADDMLDAVQCATLGSARQVLLSSTEGGIDLRGDGWPAARADATSSVGAEVAAQFAGAFDAANLTSSLKAMSGRWIDAKFTQAGALMLTPSSDDGLLVLAYPWRHHLDRWPVVGAL